MTHPTKRILGTISAAAVVALTAVSSAVPANAITRVETTNSDCSAIRATLIREGEAILRHTSKRGLPIYDRYVSTSRLCQRPSVGVWASVPARDTTSCRVIRCNPTPIDDENGLFTSRPLLRITAP